MALLHAEELEQSDRPVQLDEQFDVAVGVGFPMRDGAEERQVAHTESEEFFSVPGEPPLDFAPIPGLPITALL